jgi:hypothetical protein
VIKMRARGIARPSGRAILFAGAALVPVALMGVTVPSAVSVREAALARIECRDRLDERNELAHKLAGYGADGVIDEIEVLERVLRGLVPTDLDVLEVFGTLRAVAALRGTELTTIQLVRTHGTGAANTDGRESQAGTAIVIDEVLVGLTDTIGDSFALVDNLRASGIPTLVLGFEFSRENVLAGSYQTELRLGFLRRVRLEVDAAELDMNQ